MNSLRRRIDRFCVMHPNFGIPNLMLYIVAGNIIFFLLSQFSSLGLVGFYEAFSFNTQSVLHGEIWRILTFSFLPAYASPFGVLLSCYFYYWIGSTLEREWGTAKFTLYYVSGIVLTALGATLIALLFHFNLTVCGAEYVNLAMFFAFAMLYPDAQVLLFFIIPIKIKYLAILDACLFAYNIFFGLFSGTWFFAVLPLMALLNFFVFFAPDIQRFAKTERRRAQQTTHFHNSVKQTAREQRAQGYRHKCCVCGKTDTDYPDLQFRYCSKCAGYHCFCVDHIFNHVHFTDEQP